MSRNRSDGSARKTNVLYIYKVWLALTHQGKRRYTSYVFVDMVYNPQISVSIISVAKAKRMRIK